MLFRLAFITLFQLLFFYRKKKKIYEHANREKERERKREREREREREFIIYYTHTIENDEMQMGKQAGYFISVRDKMKLARTKIPA